MAGIGQSPSAAVSSGDAEMCGARAVPAGTATRVSGEDADDGRRCALCGGAVEGRRSDARFCGSPCAEQAHELRAILDGRKTGGPGYASIAERFAADLVPGSALERTLRRVAAIREARRAEFEALPAGEQRRRLAFRAQRQRLNGSRGSA